MARPKAFDEQKILNKAMRLFWEKGYQATSIQDLEEHLNVGRRSLYNTFGSKHDLFLTALDQYTKTESPDFDGSCPETSSVDLIQAIFEELSLEALGDSERSGCMMVNSAMELAGRDSDVTGYSENAIKAMTNGFYKLVRDGQIKKEIPIDKDPMALAQYLANTMLGFRVMAKMDPQKETFENITKVVIQSLK